MLSSGVKADNMTDVIPDSWKLGLVSELFIDTQEETNNVHQTYFNSLQDLSVPRKRLWEVLCFKPGDARL